MGLDDADARLVHVHGARQHQVDVVGHLGAGPHRQVAALGVILGEDGVGLALDLADLGVAVGFLTD